MRIVSIFQSIRISYEYKTSSSTHYSLFNKVYETGRKVATGFKESMRIVFDEHLRLWNYVAVPEGIDV